MPTATIKVEIPAGYRVVSDVLRPAQPGEYFFDPSSPDEPVDKLSVGPPTTFHYLILVPIWHPPKCMAAAAGVFRFGSLGWVVSTRKPTWRHGAWHDLGDWTGCEHACKFAGETFVPPCGDDVPDSETWTEIRKDGE